MPSQGNPNGRSARAVALVDQPPRIDTFPTFAALMAAGVEAEKNNRLLQASEYFEAAATLSKEPTEVDRLMRRAGLCRDALGDVDPS